MTSKATTVSQYLKELPTDRQAALSRLRALINKIAPKATETMKYGMPAFGDLCGFASQKHYMALYVCDGDIVDSHRSRLGKLDCGKGCIRFKHIDDLPLNAVESILKQILKLREQGIGPDCK